MGDESNPGMYTLNKLGYQKWLVHVHEQPFWEVFERDRIVVLSPDAEEDLDEVVLSFHCTSISSCFKHAPTCLTNNCVSKLDISWCNLSMDKFGLPPAKLREVSADCVYAIGGLVDRTIKRN